MILEAAVSIENNQVAINFGRPVEVLRLSALDSAILARMLMQASQTLATSLGVRVVFTLDGFAE